MLSICWIIWFSWKHWARTEPRQAASCTPWIRGIKKLKSFIFLQSLHFKRVLSTLWPALYCRSSHSHLLLSMGGQGSDGWMIKAGSAASISVPSQVSCLNYFTFSNFGPSSRKGSSQHSGYTDRIAVTPKEIFPWPPTRSEVNRTWILGLQTDLPGLLLRLHPVLLSFTLRGPGHCNSLLPSHLPLTSWGPWGQVCLVPAELTQMAPST